FLFKYPGFSWVHPWPGNGLYLHWILLGVFALFVTVGFLYRISITLFFLSHSYFVILDQGRYVNHTYLICLFSFLLIFAPAHHAFSIDAWLWPKLRSTASPAWTLWLLRAQIFPLDILPWLAIAATTLFPSPCWPRRIISLLQRKVGSPLTETVTLPPRQKRIAILTFVTLYLAVQILVPLRHFLYSGGI